MADKLTEYLVWHGVLQLCALVWYCMVWKYMLCVCRLVIYCMVWHTVACLGMEWRDHRARDGIVLNMINDYEELSTLVR
jgi:hypothetical protein